MTGEVAMEVAPQTVTGVLADATDRRSRGTLLLIEDNPLDARLVEAILNESGTTRFRLIWVQSLGEGLQQLAGDSIDLVLLDLSLPDSWGLETFDRLHAKVPAMPVIVMSGLADEAVAVCALQHGAQDYLVKGQADGGTLVRAIRYAIERQRIELALERERDLLNALIDRLPDHIYVKDAQSRFIVCNRAVAEFFGLKSPEEIIGKWDFDFFPVGLARQFQEEEQTLFGSGQSRLNRESAVADHQGQVHWVLTTKVAMRDGQGRPTGLVGINRDITVRKQAEEQLNQLNADLARSQVELLGTYEVLKKSIEELKATQLQLIQAAKMESVGRLAASVAHEVKNPLAILLMGVEYLADALRGGSEEVTMTLGQMTEAVRRADAIVRGMLDFSAAGELVLKENGLNAAIEQALLLVSHDLREQRITVERWLAADLPALRMDRPKIEQVFINLFLNAIQAMPDGGQLIVTTVRALAPDGRAQVVAQVEDTGPGIPSELLSKVFDPFFTTKATGKGTGLGLSVSRQIIELHGGRLELANRATRGVRATIVLNI